MTQCRGKTKKGDRCKRDAREGSDFCSIHQEQEIRPRDGDGSEWDQEAIITAAIGLGVVAALFFFRLRR